MAEEMIEDVNEHKHIEVEIEGLASAKKSIYFSEMRGKHEKAGQNKNVVVKWRSAKIELRLERGFSFFLTLNFNGKHSHTTLKLYYRVKFFLSISFSFP